MPQQSAAASSSQQSAASSSQQSAARSLTSSTASGSDWNWRLAQLKQGHIFILLCPWLKARQGQGQGPQSSRSSFYFSAPDATRSATAFAAALHNRCQSHSAEILPLGLCNRSCGIRTHFSTEPSDDAPCAAPAAAHSPSAGATPSPDDLLATVASRTGTAPSRQAAACRALPRLGAGPPAPPRMGASGRKRHRSGTEPATAPAAG